MGVSCGRLCLENKMLEHVKTEIDSLQGRSSRSGRIGKHKIGHKLIAQLKNFRGVMVTSVKTPFSRRGKPEARTARSL